MTQTPTAMLAAFTDLAVRNATLVLALCRIQDATGVTDDGATIPDMVAAVEAMRQNITRLTADNTALRDRVTVLQFKNGELLEQNEMLQSDFS